jgi:hypothetical protein
VTDAFDAALAVDDAERAVLVRRALAAHPDLADEVMRLLAAHATADDFLEQPVCTLASDALADAAADFVLPPALAAEYELRGILGAGSFGVVYRAVQPSLAREVALKVSPDVGTEAQTIAGLDHPNIVRVHAVHRLPSGIRITCLQHVDGCTLRDVMRAFEDEGSAPFDGRTLLGVLGTPGKAPCSRDLARRAQIEALDGPAVVAWLAAELADALGHAHAKGVFHADVKPANILLDRAARPLLIDFNVARSAGSLGGTGFVGGTPGYMAPEQRRRLDAAARGESLPPIDEARVDVFALGKVVLALLADCDGAGAAALRAVAARATAEDPAARPASSAALAEELRAYLEERAVAASLRQSALASSALARPTATLTVLTALPFIAFFLACRLGAQFPVFAYISARTTLVYRACMGGVPVALAVIALALLAPDLRAARTLFAEAAPAAPPEALARAARLPMRLVVLALTASAGPLAFMFAWDLFVDGRRAFPLFTRPLSVLLVTAALVPLGVAFVLLRDALAVVVLPWRAGRRTRPAGEDASIIVAALLAVIPAVYGVVTLPLKRFIHYENGGSHVPAIVAWGLPVVAVVAAVYVASTARRALVVATRAAARAHKS